MRKTAQQRVVTYAFSFDDGGERVFHVSFDRQTLSPAATAGPAPAWARLENHRCANCTLDAARHRHCPAALHLGEIVETFKDIPSWHEALVAVTTEERTYQRRTSVQVALGSLIGIVMPTSGCPVMDPLRPLARFHLPFATGEETVYRTASMYLVAQHLRRQAGLAAEEGIGGLAAIYGEVRKANSFFVKRLRGVVRQDANVNALVNLDGFAMMGLHAEAVLDEFTPLFAAYLGP
jgi:hypothetical protein